jgi:hypothetical protein
MLTYLVKLGERSCPKNEGRPRDVAIWERGTFEFNEDKGLKMGPQGTGGPPVDGDKGYMWIHELRGGAGLTARFKFERVSSDETKLRFTARDVELVGPMRFEEFKTRPNIIDQIDRNRWDQIRAMTEADVFAIEQELQQKQALLKSYHAQAERRNLNVQYT